MGGERGPGHKRYPGQAHSRHLSHTHGLLCMATHMDAEQTQGWHGCAACEPGAMATMRTHTGTHRHTHTHARTGTQAHTHTHCRDGTATQLIQLAMAAARARHTAAVRAVTAISLECGANPSTATAVAQRVLAAAAAEGARGPGAPEGSEARADDSCGGVAATRAFQQRMQQQLRVTLLDNLYPMVRGCTWLAALARTCALTHTHAHTLIDTRMHTLTYTHTPCTHACANTCTYAHRRALICTYTFKHTAAHAATQRDTRV